MDLHKLLLSNPPRQWPDPTLPAVSFLMPTFGMCVRKPQLLDEAVYWFTRQDYPNVELLILNDAPNQTIQCDTPGVRCFNLPERMAVFGDKRNLLMLLAAGELCAPWDDDDISLPWRASNIAYCLEGYDWWSPDSWYYCGKGRKPESCNNGCGFTSAAFRRSAFLGQHPRVNTAEDQKACQWAWDNLRCSKVKPPKRASYCYRWGYHPKHWSGKSDMEAGFRDMDPGPKFDYVIRPRMFDDWVIKTANC